MPADQFLQLRPGVPGLQYRPGVDISTGATEAGRLAALDDGGILHPSLLGSVLRQNITGAASVDISGRAAAELTLTGPVTTLTFTGWRAATDVEQEVRFSIVQDATGGRVFDWAGVTGVWLEDPPTTLDTAPGTRSLQFRATTIDGGTTVWLEPIGVSYASSCIDMQMAIIPVPAVTAGGTIEISHTLGAVADAALVHLTTGRRWHPDWWQLNANPAGAVNIDFTDAYPAGTFHCRIWGEASAPCAIEATASEWATARLSVASTPTVTTTVAHTGPPGSVQWVYGDGVVAPATNGIEVVHTYGAPYTGEVVLRWRRGVRVQEITDSVTRWTFDVINLPRALGRLTITGPLSAVTGNINNLPPNLTYLQVEGQNTLQGAI